MVKVIAHRDCLNYAPIDVVKGICHRTKVVVAADKSACHAFMKLPKCKHCDHFKAEPHTHEMGLCGASQQEPKFMAYPDMVARSCEHYAEATK